jgi:hypothetical protein
MVNQIFRQVQEVTPPTGTLVVRLVCLLLTAHLVTQLGTLTATARALRVRAGAGMTRRTRCRRAMARLARVADESMLPGENDTLEKDAALSGNSL